jgi:hypothetical protein
MEQHYALSATGHQRGSGLRGRCVAVTGGDAFKSTARFALPIHGKPEGSAGPGCATSMSGSYTTKYLGAHIIRPRRVGQRVSPGMRRPSAVLRESLRPFVEIAWLCVLKSWYIDIRGVTIDIVHIERRAKPSAGRRTLLLINQDNPLAST